MALYIYLSALTAAASLVFLVPTTGVDPTSHNVRSRPISTVKRAGGSDDSHASPPVTLSAVKNGTVTLDNAIVSIDLNVATATMKAYRLHGVNLLETDPTAYDLGQAGRELV